MLTVGVDLAAESSRTAVAWVEWEGQRAVVRHLLCGADDEAILRALAEADKAGIDCPLGWPDAFVAFVAEHQRGVVTVPDGFPDRGWKHALTMRLTDEVAWQETGLRPLSVSTDLIGHVALRCACLLAELARRGQVIDRAGGGSVAEVYPAASLKVWGLPHTGYKRRGDARMLGELVDVLAVRAPWLSLGDTAAVCRDRHDAFDAVIAALAARAAALGLTRRPESWEEVAAARTEGWIAFPRDEATLAQLPSLPDPPLRAQDAAGAIQLEAGKPAAPTRSPSTAASPLRRPALRAGTRLRSAGISRNVRGIRRGRGHR